MTHEIDVDGPAYFECELCSISWHAGRENPAPAVCPNCGRPWDRVPLFPPATPELEA